MSAYPWYDSRWLATYTRAKAWILRTNPTRLAEFEQRLAPLRTDQSINWPIYFSRVVPWPEDARYSGPDWQQTVKRDPRLRFTGYRLIPGAALAFSGSSQWHYRDPLPRAAGARNFSKLLFFHFVPRGTADIVEPRNWPSLFGLPGLAEITDRNEPAHHLD